MDVYDYDDDLLDENTSGQTKQAIGMQFCSECNNLLYPQENRDDHSLIYRCKRCHHRQAASSNLVYTNHVQSGMIKATTLINSEISKDPTLPRDTTTKCHNCGFRESVYLTFPSKSEDEAMKLLYFCCNPECNTFWRKGEQGKEKNDEEMDSDLFG